MTDRKAGAIIINNLTNLEQAYTLAQGEIQGSVFSAINDIIKKWADSKEWDGEYNFLASGEDDKEEETWISPRIWRSASDISDDPDAWFEIDFESENSNNIYDLICLTSLCNVGNEVIGFRWKLNRDRFPGLKKPIWREDIQKYFNEHQKLSEIGFLLKNTYDGFSLFLPFVINQEILAKAYEEDDLESALDTLNVSLSKLIDSELVLAPFMEQLKIRYPEVEE